MDIAGVYRRTYNILKENNLQIPISELLEEGYFKNPGQSHGKIPTKGDLAKGYRGDRDMLSYLIAEGPVTRAELERVIRDSVEEDERKAQQSIIPHKYKRRFGIGEVNGEMAVRALQGHSQPGDGTTDGFPSLDNFDFYTPIQAHMLDEQWCPKYLVHGIKPDDRGLKIASIGRENALKPGIEVEKTGRPDLMFSKNMEGGRSGSEFFVIVSTKALVESCKQGLHKTQGNAFVVRDHVPRELWEIVLSMLPFEQQHELGSLCKLFCEAVRPYWIEVAPLGGQSPRGPRP